MSDQPPSELLEAIARSPDEVNGYRVLGDWYVERGHPYGEFIALECAMPPSTLEWHSKVALDPEQRTMMHRHDELLSLYGQEWLDHVAELTIEWRWGFIRVAGVSASGAKRLLQTTAAQFVRELRLSGDEGVAALNARVFQTVTDLTINASLPRAAPWLESLVKIVVLGEQEAAFPSSAILPSIERLEFELFTAAQLAVAPTAPKLRQVEIYAHSAAALRALCEWPLLGRIDHLMVSARGWSEHNAFIFDIDSESIDFEARAPTVKTELERFVRSLSL